MIASQEPIIEEAVATSDLQIRILSGMLRTTHSLVLIASIFLVAACTQRIFSVENEKLLTPEKVSLSQVGWEIERAAAIRGWNVERKEPGRLEAKRAKRKSVLVVEITHTTKTMSIRYKDSVGLRYNGTNIHRTANGWIRSLKKSIIGRTAMLTARATNTEAVPGSNRVGRSSSLRKIGSGSGFVVSNDGSVVTNYHVIKDCYDVRINSKVFETLMRDDDNDLALLKGESKDVADIAVFRSGRGIRLGDDIIVAGYPLQDYTRPGLNITKGSVSALPSTRHIQFTAPVQPGNSGGPLLDTSGNVVGVVVARLDALKMVKSTGTLPQNVNFAISGGIIRAFLDSRNVDYGTAASRDKLPTADIVATARGFTVPIECWD